MSEDEKIPKLSIEEIEKEDPFKNRTDFYVYVHYTNESTPRPFYGGLE